MSDKERAAQLEQLFRDVVNVLVRTATQINGPTLPALHGEAYHLRPPCESAQRPCGLRASRWMFVGARRCPRTSQCSLCVYGPHAILARVVSLACAGAPARMCTCTPSKAHRRQLPRTTAYCITGSPTYPPHNKPRRLTPFTGVSDVCERTSRACWKDKSSGACVPREPRLIDNQPSSSSQGASAGV